MKIFSFITIFFVPFFICADQCINLNISHNCQSNLTTINAFDGVISFSANAKWNKGEIDYFLKRGSEIFRINVSAQDNYLRLILFYHNNSANLRLNPQTGHFDVPNVNEFSNFINSMNPGFLNDIRNFLSDAGFECGTTNTIIDLYNMLTNPQHPNFAVGGLILGKIVVGDEITYGICWYSCMAGCIYGGGNFTDCSLECWDQCKDLLD